MVLETMADPTSRILFQNFCLQDSLLADCFDFLDHVQQYKDYSQASIQIQMDLFEKSKDFVITKDKELPIEKDQHLLKSIMKTERKLRKMEKFKQELAFDICFKYLDAVCDNRTIITRVSASCLEDLTREIDQFNNQLAQYEEFDIIPDELFNTAEYQVAESISLSHNIFLKNKISVK